MHAATAWALLFWFLLRYTFTPATLLPYGNCRIHPRFSICQGNRSTPSSFFGGATKQTSNCIERCSWVKVRPRFAGSISPRTGRRTFLKNKITIFSVFFYWNYSWLSNSSCSAASLGVTQFVPIWLPFVVILKSNLDIQHTSLRGYAQCVVLNLMLRCIFRHDPTLLWIWSLFVVILKSDLDIQHTSLSGWVPFVEQHLMLSCIFRCDPPLLWIWSLFVVLLMPNLDIQHTSLIGCTQFVVVNLMLNCS